LSHAADRRGDARFDLVNRRSRGDNRNVREARELRNRVVITPKSAVESALAYLQDVLGPQAMNPIVEQLR
jgi:hypothetical protein